MVGVGIAGKEVGCQTYLITLFYRSLYLCYIRYINIMCLLQDSSNGTPVTLRVDPKGFYLYWTDQNNELDLLDITLIRDVRTGPFAKKPRVSVGVCL